MNEMIYKMISFTTTKMKSILIHNYFIELLMTADSKKRVVPSQINTSHELWSWHLNFNKYLENISVSFLCQLSKFKWCFLHVPSMMIHYSRSALSLQPHVPFGELPQQTHCCIDDVCHSESFQSPIPRFRSIHSTDRKSNRIEKRQLIWSL